MFLGFLFLKLLYNFDKTEPKAENSHKTQEHYFIFVYSNSGHSQNNPFWSTFGLKLVPFWSPSISESKQFWINSLSTSAFKILA